LLVATLNNPRRTAGGSRRVFAADAIAELAGIMKANGSEYLTTRCTSLLSVVQINK